MYCIPKKLIRILLVLGIVVVLYQIIYPRTSLNFRYSLYQPKFGNYLTEQKKVMVSGESFYLKVKTINQRLSFSSSDFKVAFVDRLGKVTAYQPGTAYIKVKTRDKTMVCKIEVIALNHTKLIIEQGDKKNLNIRGVWFFESYKSSNPKVATVSWTGKVTAIKKGTTTITASAKGRKIYCKVQVK